MTVSATLVCVAIAFTITLALFILLFFLHSADTPIQTHLYIKQRICAAFFWIMYIATFAAFENAMIQHAMLFFRTLSNMIQSSLLIVCRNDRLVIGTFRWRITLRVMILLSFSVYIVCLWSLLLSSVYSKDRANNEFMTAMYETYQSLYAVVTMIDAVHFILFYRNGSNHHDNRQCKSRWLLQMVQIYLVYTQV
jgi:hypothetical protein